MSKVERQYLHSSFNPMSDGVVNVSSQKLTRLSTDIGKSTLQLQLGAQVTRSLIYSSNNFSGKEAPISDIIKVNI